MTDAKKHILVIDDQDYNLTLLQEFLEFEGYRVSCAPDAERGLEIAQRERPSLILMDLTLPGMDGLDATRTLRHTPDLETMPVVALSAHEGTSFKKRSLEAGCNAYLAKPYDIETLLEIIDRLTTCTLD